MAHIERIMREGTGADRQLAAFQRTNDLKQSSIKLWPRQRGSGACGSRHGCAVAILRSKGSGGAALFVARTQLAFHEQQNHVFPLGIEEKFQIAIRRDASMHRQCEKDLMGHPSLVLRNCR